MKIGIVVNDFPVLSETFIVRMIEDLSKSPDVNLVIIALGGFNKSLLSTLSKEIYTKVCNDQIEVVSDGEIGGYSSATERLKRYVKALFLSLLFPVPVSKALFKKKIR